jgi:hypothetical protein
VCKLFSIDTGFCERPNLTRTLASIVVMAETKDDALRFARHRYPEVLSQGTELRIVEVDHLLVDWPDGSVVIVEKLHSKQLPS